MGNIVGDAGEQSGAPLDVFELNLFEKEVKPMKIPKGLKPAFLRPELSHISVDWSTTTCTDSENSSIFSHLSGQSESCSLNDGFNRQTSVTILKEMQRQVSHAGFHRQVSSGLEGVLMQSMQDMSRQNSCSSSASSRKEAVRRTWRRFRATMLFVTCTMGSEPSAALQLVIVNPGKVEDFYNVLNTVLGTGAFGKVFAAKVTSTGADRAVKVISKTLMREHMGVLRDEIDIMKLISHQNALVLFEVFEDEEHISLVTELCAGGDVENYVLKKGRMSETNTAMAMQQVLRAVHHLHAKRICHRDLKSSNLLLSRKTPFVAGGDNSIKVADFGLSTRFKPGTPLRQDAGTNSHKAPEVFSKCYTEACDLWSCGVIMYFILCTTLPFSEQLIKAKSYRLGLGSAAWADVSQPAIALLQGLITVKVENRLNAQQALQHKWILSTCATADDSKVPLDVLRSLSKHRAQNRFKQACLSVVASLLGHQATADSRRYFLALDTKGNGLVPASEIRKRLKVLGEEVAEGTLADKHHTDFTYLEFVAATFNRKRYLTDKLCKAAFSVFDKNGDENISVSEIIGGRLLGHLTSDEVFQTLDELDKNGDAQIDLEEFSNMLRD
eukprot:TRINITY_DN17808_c0_g1_i2.p1 TRINITY_DN17808_c0_g1~~TRINITY_DN17808_c0_g1_i2.p1  ORF type:complete len:611 (+),score=96.75 TRINITY_DN17808_c0_g1_i2:39-1871(+)